MEFLGRPVPFTMTNREISGSRKTILLYECAKCLVSDFVIVRTGVPLKIENSNNSMKHRGWVIHKSRKSKVYCPTCKVADSGNDVDSELRKILAVAPAPLFPAIAQVQEIHVASASAIPTTVAPIRPITSDQRLAIRNALELTFDDKKGQYLDNTSDETIAVKLGIPRIHVETIRETAYGPIRVDPELAAIFKDIEDIKRMAAEFSAIQANMSKGLEDINRRIASVSERVAQRAK